MEATAVSLARTVLDGVLGSAGSAVADEAALLLGVRREVEFIRNELEMMQSFLRVASACPEAGGRRGCSKDTVRTWVKQVRDLAYDVEDCLLDFMLHASRPSCAPWLPGPLAARHRIAERIRGLKASVEELNQRNQRYHIIVDDDDHPPAEEHELSHDDHLRSELAFQGLQVIGRDKDKVELVELAKLIIRGVGRDRRVVSVWGMGGMGKSSVARMLYDDPDLLDCFDCRAWVTVPHPLDNPHEFKRRLGKQLDVAYDHVSALLEEKRYLVVVDDLWSQEEWEHISLCFPENDTGGLIIVTTRREDVARHCAGDTAENAYELKPLGDEEARKLLCQKVYKDAEYTLPDDMLEQANDILKRLRGFPLSIATIGGLLANRPKTGREWEELRRHLGSELESDRDIKRVITSSYDGLPYHLKSCFLYLSLFPENHEIRCTRLLRRWMAEGYIEKRRDMTVEEVGQRHYNELINRSMILPSKKKVRASMAVERCQIHGVVLQIILSKSIEENQLFIIDKHCNEVPESKIRHLVVTRWKRSEEKMARINLSRIRSLTVFGECPASLISSKLRLLRVLDLEDTVELENDDLKHIGELHHLRYLGLRGTKISRLPSLQNLRYLETLDVQDTKLTQLPDGISKLNKLRYLIAGVNFAEDLVEKMEKRNNAAKCNGNFLGTLADFVCRCCRGYEECCESSSSCCAGQFSVRAPEGIEKLRNLRMLGVVHIGQGSGVASKLGELTSLRRLGVDLCVTKEEGSKLCMSLGRLVRLERLEVRSESLQFLKDMSESPPKHLLSLRLCGHLGEFPDWISSLNDLAKVKLLRTQLEQKDIELIGNLRNLASLGLWGKSFAGESLHFRRDTFKKLKLLDIEGLQKIKTVQIEDGAMPELEKLRVKKCTTLSDSKDGLSGVQYLRNLNEIVLASSGEKHQLESILQGQVSGFVKRPKLLIGRSRVIKSTNPSPRAATVE